MTDDEARELREGDYVTVIHDEPAGRPRRVTQVLIGASSIRVRTQSIGGGGVSLPWLPPASLSRVSPEKQWDRRRSVWRDRRPGSRGVFWEDAPADLIVPDPLRARGAPDPDVSAPAPDATIHAKR